MWVLHAEGEEPRTLRLAPGAVRTVGRDNRSDFVVSDRMMSRIHCRLLASEGDLVVADLGSTNGTFVNGARVEEIALKEGDHLRIGRSDFRIARDRPAPAPPARD